MLSKPELSQIEATEFPPEFSELNLEGESPVKLSTKNLKRLKEAVTLVPESIIVEIRRQLSTLPLSFRHETLTNLETIIAEGELKPYKDLSADTSRIRANTFPEDQENFNNHGFVFLSPAFGSKNQESKDHPAFFIPPEKVQGRSWFSFTDWLFLKEHVENGEIPSVTADFYLFSDFLEAFVYKTALRLQLMNSASKTAIEITRYDLVASEFSQKGQSIAKGMNTIDPAIYQQVDQAIQMQIVDCVENAEVKVAGRVNLIGSYLCETSRHSITGGVRDEIKFTHFTSASGEIPPKKSQVTSTDFLNRRGELRKIESIIIHQFKRLS